MQPGKPIEHLEMWYEKLSDSVPLSLVHSHRRPYVIKGRDLEKADIQKGFGDQKDQAERNFKDHSSQERFQEPVQEPVQKPFLELVQKSSQEASQNSQQNSTPVQPIVIPPGIPNKSPKKVNFKVKLETLSI